MLRITFMSLLLVGLIRVPADAQSAAARREDLAQVQEMLADPDPMMRLAHMKIIMTGADQLKQRRASLSQVLTLPCAQWQFANTLPCIRR